MKLEKDQFQMVAALLLVAVIAAAILAVTDIFTREPIAAAKKEALQKALQMVLPAHSNDPQTDQVLWGSGKQALKLYPAKDTSGRLNGLAWEVVAPDGYSGSIRVLLGLQPDGRIQAIRVTDHRETPGLGDGIVRNDPWLKSFVDKTLAGTRWAVKKDGGDFDQFTGATITPRAVVKAVKLGLEFYHEHRQEILLAIKDRANKGTGHGGQQ